MDDATITRCLGCRRPLRSATSIARGRGRTCARKIRQAAAVVDLSAYTARQIDDALELIDDGAILAVDDERSEVVSSDGSDYYLTAQSACTCPAGVSERRCYHTAAVRILAAA